MIRQATFYLNPEKPTVFETAYACLDACAACSINPILMVQDRAEWERRYPEDIRTLQFEEMPVTGDDAALFVFGGDGTVLRALDAYGTLDIPMLGINLGRLGFLPEVQAGEMRTALQRLAAGDYIIERRLMLHAEIHTGNGVRETVATNEIYLTRGLSQRIIAMDVYADGQLVEHYISDGVIVSSPTGSTAYSLSAGGPIIAPNVDCLLINPICPHTLESRPIIVRDTSVIEIVLHMKEAREGIQLSADGAMLCSLANDDRVVIRRAPHDALMLRLPGERNFYALLKSKLSQWSL